MSNEVQVSNEVRDRFARVNQRDLHYVDEGTGQPLVLVHGWGFDLTCWRPMIDRLATRYRVIAVDVRGHGRSQPADSAYTLKDLALDLSELLTQLNLPEPPVLIGHSLGGSIVQQFAAEHPNAARAIIIMDSDLNASVAKRLIMSSTNRIFAWVMRLAAVILGPKRSLRLYPPLLNIATYSGGWRKAHPELLKDAADRFLDNRVKDLVWSLVAWASRPDLTENLAAVSCPALLIRGSKDLMITDASMQALSRAFPRSQLLVVEDSGHAILSEQPDIVVGMIDSFLQQPDANAERDSAVRDHSDSQRRSLSGLSTSTTVTSSLLTN